MKRKRAAIRKANLEELKPPTILVNRVPADKLPTHKVRLPRTPRPTTEHPLSGDEENKGWGDRPTTIAPVEKTEGNWDKNWDKDKDWDMFEVMKRQLENKSEQFVNSQAVAYLVELEEFRQIICKHCFGRKSNPVRLQPSLITEMS